MRKITTIGLNEELWNSLQNKKVNVSKLCNTLLSEWLGGERPTRDQIREDLGEARTRAAVESARVSFLERQLKDLDMAGEAERMRSVFAERNKWKHPDELDDKNG